MPLSPLWMLLTVTFFGAVAIVFDSERNPTSKENNTKSFTEKQTADNKPSPDSSSKPTWLWDKIKAIKTHFHDNRAKKKTRNAADRASERIAVATWAIFCASAATIVVGYWQYGVIKGQLDELRDEQRPWIGAPISIRGYIKENGRLKIDINFINVGKLPTLSFGVDGGIVDGENSWTNEAAKFCQKLASRSYENTFAAIPGSQWPIPSDNMPSGSKFPQIDAFRRMSDPFVAGCAVYKIRGDALPHKTPFGAHLIIKGDSVEMDRAYSYDAN